MSLHPAHDGDFITIQFPLVCPFLGPVLTRCGFWQVTQVWEWASALFAALGNHGAIHISDCVALWDLGFLCSLPCSAWATWDWMLVGGGTPHSLP